MDGLEEQLVKQLDEVRAEREELGAAKRVRQRRGSTLNLGTILGIARSSFSYWRRTAADRAPGSTPGTGRASRVGRDWVDGPVTYVLGGELDLI
ncbi:hypothetical protein [Streptomyces sp. NPDC004976]